MSPDPSYLYYSQQQYPQASQPGEQSGFEARWLLAIASAIGCLIALGLFVATYLRPAAFSPHDGPYTSA